MPSPPTYAQDYQVAAFFPWLNAELEKRKVSKSRLAAALGYDSIQHINKILRGKLPMPATLHRLCEAAGIPWLAAFAVAGYYRYIIYALQCLAAIAYQQMADDEVQLEESFRSLGVLRIRGTGYWEIPNFNDQYHVGQYVQDLSQVDLSELSEDDRARRIAEANHPVPYAVPKALAAAIIIAVNAFPRRGDVWKPGVQAYSVDIVEAITPLIEFPEEPGIASPLLAAADQVLRDRVVPLDARRVIAAEYLVSWADSHCSGYTHYVRLASFDLFGVAGYTSDNPGLIPAIELPQLRRSTLPGSSEFSSILQPSI